MKSYSVDVLVVSTKLYNLEICKKLRGKFFLKKCLCVDLFMNLSFS